LIDFAYYYIKSLHLSKQVILWIYLIYMIMTENVYYNI